MYTASVPLKTSQLHRPIAIWVAVVAVAIYLPTVGHGFAFDDDVVIVKNRLLRSAGELPRLVARTEWSGSGVEVRAYRPLTGVSYALNVAVSGSSPWSYHLVNVLLHGLAAGLLALLALRLGLGAAVGGAAALLFALHPIHVEAVANVVGRKDLLATVFLLAMVLAHRRAVLVGGWRVALPAVVYAAAMLSKEVGAVGLALAGIVDLAWPQAGAEPRATRRRRVALYASYLAVLAGYLLLLRAVTAGVPAAAIAFEDNPAASASLPVRLMTAVAVIGKGLALQAVPVGQSPDWSYDAIPLVTSALDTRFVASVVALAGWLALGWWTRRRSPAVLVGLGWYLVALLPASNILFPVGTIFGERLLYLPSVGLAFAVAAALAPLAARVPRRANAVAAVVVLAALGIATVRYSAVWADDGALFRHATARVPSSAKAHQKLAQILLRQGHASEALAAIDRALAIHPRDSDAHLTRAEILGAAQRPRDQEAALRRAVAESPGNADALYAIGRLARDAGRIDEAAVYWRLAIGARPMHAPSLADLGTYHLVRREMEAALELLQRAVVADDRMASAWYNLALIRRDRGEDGLARAALTRFVEVAGDDYAAEAAAARGMLRARGEPAAAGGLL